MRSQAHEFTLNGYFVFRRACPDGCGAYVYFSKERQGSIWTCYTMEEAKAWIRGNNPPPQAVKDIAKVAKNNDIFKEVCSEN